MKKTITILLLVQAMSGIAISDSTKHFEASFEELKAMIEGSTEPNFERAVYLSEAPYWNNSYKYEDFQKLIDLQIDNLKLLIAANDQSENMDFSVKVRSNGRFHMNDLLYTETEKKALYADVLKNWAIFKYITDTTAFYSYMHYPFSYSTHDPFGLKNWRTSQVINLIGTSERSGNCYALTALYKVLSERLNTKATICTAPQHIYIQHRDHKGSLYNVELATAGHPSDGQLQVLTHTPSEGIRSGIALRSYDDRQAIGLLLVNLAKSYERTFNTKSDDFLLKCAELVLKYDDKNLNALLLKQQVLDIKVFDFISSEDITNLDLVRDNPTFVKLEDNTKLLYNLGYRPMPVDMQKAIMDGFSNSNEARVFYNKNKNPKPFTTITPLKKEDEEYVTLSGGLFREIWTQEETEIFGHFVYETATQTVKEIEVTNYQEQIIDPVAFAYNFGARMYDARIGRWFSTDPSEARYAGWSPYNFTMNNPILYVDPDGKDSRVAITRNKGGGGTITITTVAHVYGEGAQAMADYNNNLLENLNTSSSVEIDGEVWTVNINIEFKANERLNNLDPKKEGLTYQDAKGVKGVKAGDNFVCADCPLSDPRNIEEGARGGSKTKAPAGNYTALHGVFHNLGLGDDYANEGDVMSRTIPDKIDQKHFENLAKGILNLHTPQQENGITYPAQSETFPKSENGETIISGEEF